MGHQRMGTSISWHKPEVLPEEEWIWMKQNMSEWSHQRFGHIEGAKIDQTGCHQQRFDHELS